MPGKNREKICLFFLGPTVRVGQNSQDFPDCRLTNLTVHFFPENLWRNLSRTVGPSQQEVQNLSVLTWLTLPVTGPSVMAPVLQHRTGLTIPICPWQCMAVKMEIYCGPTTWNRALFQIWRQHTLVLRPCSPKVSLSLCVSVNWYRDCKENLNSFWTLSSVPT